ncbi:hypothetical protein B0H15DRAFT_807437 [Mycena belliarum]|uniref:Uncharacterized protein n=1 Tax=Mycena belliarum TaxID=1033014 RepID=A0AAD6TNR3_9AGAR|nr:hypothetical protein B0H15DRAFT_807437 [Mycena belliae]
MLSERPRGYKVCQDAQFRTQIRRTAMRPAMHGVRQGPAYGERSGVRAHRCTRRWSAQTGGGGAEEGWDKDDALDSNKDASEVGGCSDKAAAKLSCLNTDTSAVMAVNPASPRDKMNDKIKIAIVVELHVRRVVGEVVEASLQQNTERNGWEMESSDLIDNEDSPPWIVFRFELQVGASKRPRTPETKAVPKNLKRQKTVRNDKGDHGQRQSQAPAETQHSSVKSTSGNTKLPASIPLVAYGGISVASGSSGNSPPEISSLMEHVTGRSVVPDSKPQKNNSPQVSSRGQDTS